MSHIPFHVNDAPAHPFPSDTPSHMRGFAKATLLGIAIVITITGVLFYAFSKNKIAVNSYEECAKLPDSVIQESYPPVCVTQDGRRFTQEVSSSDPAPDPKTQVIVTEPTEGTFVQSPLVVSGTVPPGWMFEGSFPLRLEDESGAVLAEVPVQEKVGGSWTSGNPIEFTTTLTFSTNVESGKLIFKKDNPSGLPENDVQHVVPVSFISSGSTSSPKTTCVQNNGGWSEAHNECGGVSKSVCDQMGGKFNECASPCRHDPDAQVCIMMCEQVCTF